MSTKDTDIGGGESSTLPADYQPKIPNSDAKAVGDLVAGHDAFARKFIIFGEVVAVADDVLTIKCPCCDNEVRKHVTLVALLPPPQSAPPTPAP